MTLRVIKLVCLAVLSAALAIIVFSVMTGWLGAWHAFNVWTMTPIFADMRTVPLPSEIPPDISLRDENPIDPWGRAFNYPWIWAYIMVPFSACADRNICYGLAQLALLWSVLAAAIVLARQRLVPVLVVVLFLSPPILLLVERGNNDGLVFALVALAATLPAAFGRTLLITLAATLKLFPLVALGNRDMLRHRWSWSLAVTVMLPAIAWSFWGWLQIYASTPFSHALSFGTKSLSLLLWRENARLGDPLPGAALDPLVVTVALLLLSLALYRAQRQTIRTYCAEILRDARDARFLVLFGAIFLGVFVATGNWAYRIIFLVPPAIVILSAVARSTAPPTWLRPCLWGVFLANFWSPMLPGGWVVFNVISAASFVLLVPFYLGVLLGKPREQTFPNS